MFAYPTTDAGFWKWFLVLMAGYIMVAAFLRWRHDCKLKQPTTFSHGLVFDGATFGTSSALLWGIVDPSILQFLGNTQLFLIISGLAGFAYCIYALLPKS